MLEAHGLTDWFSALHIFPGGFARRAWVSHQYDRIFERDGPGRRERAASDVARKDKSRVKTKRGALRDTSVPVPAVETPTAHRLRCR